jgi:hypothetical protein
MVDSAIDALYLTCDLLYDLMQMGALVRPRLEEMGR